MSNEIDIKARVLFELFICDSEKNFLDLLTKLRTMGINVKYHIENRDFAVEHEYDESNITVKIVSRMFLLYRAQLELLLISNFPITVFDDDEEHRFDIMQLQRKLNLKLIDNNSRD